MKTTFSTAYLECALWSSTDDNDDPLDKHDGEVSLDTLEQMEEDCANFQEANAELLEQAYREPEWQAEDQRYDKPHYNAEQAGHDFWLTRCGHGTGFWDRGLGDIGDKLSDACKPYGNVDLYLGDDGKIYSI